MTHELKIWPEYFKQLLSGNKPFELRKNDRGFQADDKLLLREYSLTGGFSGRQISAEISCVVSGEWLADGYCALGLKNIKEE